MPSERLSVTVIARDEERNLARCLASVAWADEIVLVDSGSTDATRDIGRRFGARVVEQPWLGYAAQKNLAAERAAHRFVLSLDADEWLPEETARELRRELEAPRADAYALRRRSALSAGFVRRAWGPDWQVRFYRKDRARFGGGAVHESVRPGPGARVARLDGHILHLTARSIGEWSARMNRYAALAAPELARRGRRHVLVRLVLSPPAAFLRSYLVRGGVLDGVRGLVVGAEQAHYVLLKYAAAWERLRGVEPGWERTVPATGEDPDPARIQEG